jgi:carboxylesterase type B
VTIWGESAGALSVGMHLTAYNGRDDKIFRGAIMQSGNPINYGTFDYDKTDLLNASAQLGCNPSGPVLDCLRQIPFPKLNAWINSTQGLSMDWQPIIDGDFIQGKTSVQLAKGDFVHVPIIDGANSDEGSAFGPKPMNSTEQFINRLTHSAQPVILTPAQAAQVLKAYPQNATDYPPMNLPPSYVPGPGLGAESRRSDAYYGDVTMIAPRRKTCQTWAKAKVPAYCYRFNTIPHGVPSFVGATHFQEVAFVFDNTMGMGYGYPGVSQNPFEGEPEGYFELADAMSGAWASFIHDGMPGAFWPKYKVNTHPGDVGQNWVFDANVTGLGLVEEDSWRKEGIQLIGEWDADVYHR